MGKPSVSSAGTPSVPHSPLRTPGKSGTPKLRRKKTTIEETFVEGTSSRRLVEYFVVVSSLPRWATPQSPSNKQGPASPPEKLPQEDSGNIRMPTSKDNDYTFQPKITARYPLNDYADHALNPMVTQFCYPHSDVIFPSKAYVMPRIHHFVLTNDKGTKVYGTCLTIYEEYISSANDPCRTRDLVHGESGELDIEVTNLEDGSEETLYIPRVLCILSTWPYLTAFREYLTQLYRLATTTDMMEAPIERHVQNLCVEIPAPPPGAFEIHVSILNSTIRFWAPPAKLPIAYVALPYQLLFECLDVKNILTVWYALALERKILLLSSQSSLLTICAEIFCSLLFPMQWSHLYIPLLPRFLSPMLDAPFPYLCGVARENWLHAEQHVSEETMVVDLDSNTVTVGSRDAPMPPVPAKKWNKLQAALEENVGALFYKARGLEKEYQLLQDHKMSQRAFEKLKTQSYGVQWKEKLSTFDEAFNLAYTPDSLNLVNFNLEESQQSKWDKVQEAFLRFFVSLFKDYRKFLHLPEANSAKSVSSNSDPHAKWSQSRSFDRDGFIVWQKAESQSFMQQLCMTQLFDDFITKRLYSPGEPDVIFFDQSIDEKLNRSRLKVKKVDTPFLQSAKAHKLLKSVKAVAPSQEGLSAPASEKNRYMYASWPERFDPKLFGAPRQIPSIINAEFDRQSALVARLRANVAAEAEAEHIPVEFYGGDYAPVPEVATFTVFFFTYAAVIGREWQQYQQKRLELEANLLLEEVEAEFPLHENLDAAVDVAPENDAADPALDQEPKQVDSSSHMDEKKEVDLLPDFPLSLPDDLIDCTRDVCDLCPDYSNPVTLLKEEIMTHVEQFDRRRSEVPEVNSSVLDFDEDLAEFEEAKDVATAQLDLAFAALTTMSLRGLAPDPDSFHSLMEACGRCGDTDRAFRLMDMMKKEGLVTNSEVYASLLKAFAYGDGAGLNSGEGSPRLARKGSDAYTTYLKKKCDYSKLEDGITEISDTLSSSGEGSYESGSVMSSDTDGSVPAPQSSIVAEFYSAVSQSIENFRTPHKKTKPTRRRRRKKNRRRLTYKDNSFLGTVVTDGVRKQIVLGESLLDFLYPNLVIDSNSDSCPQCSKVLTQDEIVVGWQTCEFQDYTTQCPQCQHRFVPRFSVQSSSPSFEGSQGKSTPLYCEFLSPWVLRQEVEHVIHGADGIEGMLNPEWRSGTDIKATLWWNMIVAFKRYRLPVSFLLQGSFQNRLINPTPDA